MKATEGNSSQTSEFDELESLFYTLVKKKKKQASSPKGSPEPKTDNKFNTEIKFSNIPDTFKTALGSEIMRLVGGEEVRMRGKKAFKLTERDQITSKMVYDSVQPE